MGDTILGLPTTKKLDDAGLVFNAYRRRLLRVFPNGGCSITGLVSMLKGEEVSDPTFITYAKYWNFPETATRGTNPLTKTAPSTGDADDGTVATSTETNATSGVVYLKVATTKFFRPGVVIQVGSNNNQYRITSVTKGVADESLLGYVTANPVRAVTYTGTQYTAGTKVLAISTAMGEGASGTGMTPLGYLKPISWQNQTQIFRTPVTFTGSVLQQGAKFDVTGIYQDRCKDQLLEHALQMETAFLFGKRSITTRASFDSSQEDLTVRTTGGIIEQLTLWDAGSTGITIDGATYAPYNHQSAQTSDSDDEKRIITNSAGTFTVDSFNTWMERLYRYSTNKTRDRIAFCGSGAIKAMHTMLRKNGEFEVKLGDEAYGFGFNTIKTPFGNLHFTEHPLFTKMSNYRNSALIIDPNAHRIRPLTGRDTKLLKNRQPNDADYRKDEYLSEVGFEHLGIETSMLINNLTTYVQN